jgi:hypothetical protein
MLLKSIIGRDGNAYAGIMVGATLALATAWYIPREVC